MEWINIYYAVCVTALVVASARAQQTVTPPPPGPDPNLPVGNWSVGDCLLVKFGMAFNISMGDRQFQDIHDLQVVVAADAEVDPDAYFCQKMENKLNLRWSDRVNDVLLQRSLIVTFSRTNSRIYGVSSLKGHFSLGSFEWTNSVNKSETKNVTAFISVDSGELKPYKFVTPFKRSYLCPDLGKWNVSTILHFSSDPSKVVLPNALIASNDVQFDAFRGKSERHGLFRAPIDCMVESNDIVPIIVGVTLASMVVFVLGAYVYGSRKRRQRGYQSV